MDYSGNIVRDAAARGPNLILYELQSLTTDLADLTHGCNFHQVLTAHIVVSSVNSSLSGHVRSSKTVPIDFMTLAGRWMIAPDRAKETVQQTTQRDVRTCLNPTLARQFPTNDPMLCYKRLPHTTFTDTIFAGMPSCSGNKCAQVYSTSFGWARAHPMTRKGEAHETLSLPPQPRPLLLYLMTILILYRHPVSLIDMLLVLIFFFWFKFKRNRIIVSVKQWHNNICHRNFNNILGWSFNFTFAFVRTDPFCTIRYQFITRGH